MRCKIMSERERAIQMKFRVTPEEKEMIKFKMCQIGTNNFDAYARKMSIDGYIIKHDFKELRALTAELGKIGSNINQIAKRANETRNVYEEDIKDLLQMLYQVQVLFNNKVGKLIK